MIDHVAARGPIYDAIRAMDDELAVEAGGQLEQALDDYADWVRAELSAERKRQAGDYVAEFRAKAALSDLGTTVLRAMSILRHGVEMVGSEPYEFTKDEVLDEAFAALDDVRAVLQVPEPNITAPPGSAEAIRDRINREARPFA